jgi:hypothetical protein
MSNIKELDSPHWLGELAPTETGLANLSGFYTELTRTADTPESHHQSFDRLTLATDSMVFSTFDVTV